MKNNTPEPDNVPHPFDKLPDSHLKHVNQWLASNLKRPDEVQWSLYPIGMVQRWIERAEAAERTLREADSRLRQAADKKNAMSVRDAGVQSGLLEAARLLREMKNEE